MSCIIHIMFYITVYMIHISPQVSEVKPLQLASALLSFLILGACGSVSLGGLTAASRLDPINTPPGDVALAISVPDAVQLVDGDAVLRITFAEDGRQLVNTEVPLTIARSVAEAGVRQHAGETTYVGHLAEAEAQAFAMAQAEIRRLRSKGSEGRGSLQIRVTNGCRVGPPLEALQVSTWLRTDPEARFVQLTRRIDVLEELQSSGVSIPAC